MRRTRKRGGATEEEKAEAQEAKQFLALIASAKSREEKIERVKQFLEAIMQFRHIVRIAGFRRALYAKIEELWDIVDLRPELRRVMAHLDSFSEGSTVGGRRHTRKRKTRRLRKTYRK